ncbi:MAG: dihydroorotase [Bacteroidaceae bacterium]|nr:dihydroorotase [Bacteroidaceae bacterium]
MKTILIKNATLVNEGEQYVASVLIEGEKIKQIFRHPEDPLLASTLSFPEAEEIIDATNKLLLPGVIDDHVHFRDPGLTHKGDLISESRAAAAGGVTSYMDMPNCQPQTTTLEALSDKHAHAAAESRVNYSFYFGATHDNLEQLSHLDRHSVCGVKLFMGSSTGNMLVDQRKDLERIFGATDLLIATHCENSTRIAANAARYCKELYTEDPSIKYHPLIRDVEACYASTALAVELADRFKANLHVLHLSTQKELSLFQSTPLAEKRITSEACIAHLLFNDRHYAALGTRIKCNPAIKAETDQAALIAALHTGRIDLIATDHAPHLLREKNGGALKAASGMPSLQFSLISMLDNFSYPLVVEKMCHAPAQRFGIEQRGYLREGYQADLVLVSPYTPWTLTTEGILSKCGWSPFEGHTFTHRVARTFVNGQTVFDEGVLHDEVRGQALRFH